MLRSKRLNNNITPFLSLFPFLSPNCFSHLSMSSRSLHLHMIRSTVGSDFYLSQRQISIFSTLNIPSLTTWKFPSIPACRLTQSCTFLQAFCIIMIASHSTTYLLIRQMHISQNASGWTPGSLSKPSYYKHSVLDSIRSMAIHLPAALPNHSALSEIPGAKLCGIAASPWLLRHFHSTWPCSPLCISYIPTSTSKKDCILPQIVNPIYSV